MQFCTSGAYMYIHPTNGAYYSYPVATAGKTLTSNTSSDICPKGWHLPTMDGTYGGLSSNNNNEYRNLGAAYSNSAASLKAAWSPKYVGRFDDDGVLSSGSAYYVTATGTSGGYKRLIISSSTIDYSVNYYLYYYQGCGLRCVANRT